MIHRIPVTLRILEVKSDKSDWLRVRNEFYAYAQKIGPGPSSRFLMLTKTNAASGDENAMEFEKFSKLFGTAESYVKWSRHAFEIQQQVFNEH